MIAFINVTDTGKQDIWINIYNITTFYKHSEKMTYVRMIDQDVLLIKHTPEEICKMIKDAIS